MSVSFQERYHAGDSVLHQLDPRIKFITAILLILGIVLTPEQAWPAYPLLWALVGSLAIVGGIGTGRLARMGSVALPFALAAVALPFTMPGKTVLTLWGVSVSDAGLARFLAIILKSWLAVQVTMLLSMTTHFTDLLWALASLRMPKTLVAIIGFMYRYLFTLKDEATRLLRARAARSGVLADQRSGGSLFFRARIAGGMIGNLFLRSYERSERVYVAMLARGYDGRMRTLEVSPITGQAILLGSLPVVVLIIIEGLAVLLWS